MTATHHGVDHRAPRPVRIVAANPMAEHRARETRAITAVLTVVCAVAAGGAVVPAVDSIISAMLAVVIAVVVLAGLLRWGARRVRWHLEDCADARTAAAWRVEHPVTVSGPAADARTGVA